MRVVVIGGGAGGFFSAINLARLHPQYQVILLEKSNQLLSKVRVSGGGRCNVTHDCLQNSQLIKAYPRGSNFLKKVFGQFSVQDTIDWFEQRNIPLKVEDDGRMFPQANTSEAIIQCFLKEAKKYKVDIRLRHEVIQLVHQADKWQIHFKNKGFIEADRVVVATGGSPKLAGLDWLAQLGHTIVPPVPSLFTFNLADKNVTQLQGLSVSHAKVKVLKTKLEQEGALLVTHWGLSAPAVLKTSAWGARELSELQYHFEVQVSWLPSYKEEALREQLQAYKVSLKHRQISNKNPFELPNRLWEYLVQKLEITPEKKWLDLSKQDLNRLLNVLLYDTYEVKGKTTFKEEFVTCGGVSLQDINPQTMESKVCPHLYFTGEVLDIDGVTGGYNFQAAWSTAFVAAANVR